MSRASSAMENLRRYGAGWLTEAQASEIVDEFDRLREALGRICDLSLADAPLMVRIARSALTHSESNAEAGT